MDKGDKNKALSYFNKYKEKYYNFLPPKERDELNALIQKCIEEL